MKAEDLTKAVDTLNDDTEDSESSTMYPFTAVFSTYSYMECRFAEHVIWTSEDDVVDDDGNEEPLVGHLRRCAIKFIDELIEHKQALQSKDKSDI